MSTGITYYFRDTEAGADVNAVAGNDANDGLTDATAWQTWAKYQSVVNSSPAGTRYKFARGGSWTTASAGGWGSGGPNAILTGITRSGTTATATTQRAHNLEVSDTSDISGCVQTEYNGTITITAVPTTTTFEYTVSGSPATPATTLSRIRYTGAGLYTEDYTSTVYTQAVDARPLITLTANDILFDSIAGVARGAYYFSRLHVRHTGLIDGSSVGFRVFGSEVDTFIIDDCIIDGFKTGVYPDTTVDQHFNIVLKNSEIKNCVNQGIFGGWNGGGVTDNIFTNNGNGGTFGGNILLHNIYLANVDNVTIARNTCYQSGMNLSNQATSISIGAHGVCSNLIVEDNYVYEDVGGAIQTAQGIGLGAGYSGAVESFTNCIIRRNKIVNVGNAGIVFSAWIGGVIENNIQFHDQSFDSEMIVESQGHAEDPDNSDVIIRNNSGYGKIKTGVRLASATCTGMTIVSNALQSTLTTNASMLDFAYISITDNTAVDVCDNNVVYAPNAATYNYDRNVTGDLAVWQAASVFDDNSQEADPLYTSATNLTPLASSPLIDNGHLTLSAVSDYLEVSRDATPDVGAYEGFYVPTIELNSILLPVVQSPLQNILN